ncbi:Conserved_hypothetical protein [Hexamita inflata]|uniref:Uncharacterized protein n=1 Tax=Hexamita inflata TaxID=28002 RepID=A0AA86PYJ6_9EUKA|nr:Conserved hypothetical protein [Hexamita inflata]
MDPNIPIPRDVLQQMERSQLELNALEDQQQTLKQQKMDAIDTSFLQTSVLDKPQALPTELNDETYKGNAAMMFLMRDKQYTREYEVKLEAQKMRDAEDKVVNKSLRSFFLGNVPELNQKKYADDPKAYASKVLEQCAVPPKSRSTARSQLQSSQASLNLTHSTALKQNFSDAALQIKTRTLNKSMKLFQQQLEEPINSNQSIFSIAFKTQKLADFLLGDATEALSKDSKEICTALQMVRQAFQRSFSDQKAGEYLITAELSRLKQELYESELAREQLRKRSIEIALGLEEKRKIQVQQMQLQIEETEKKRFQEVQAVMNKSKEYGEQVRTLKALVDIIRQDQQVQQVEKLKQQVLDKEKEINDLLVKQLKMQTNAEKQQEELGGLKAKLAEQESVMDIIKVQLRSSESQKEYCKMCSQKILNKSKTMATELQMRIDRVTAVSNSIQSLEQGFSNDQEMLLKRIQMNQDDELMFNVDFIAMMKELLIIEDKLKQMPDIKRYELTIKDKETEIARLSGIEKELIQLRKAYKAIMAKSTDGMSGSHGQSVVAQMPTQQSSSQQVSESRVTLLRHQPINLLVPKQFKLIICQKQKDDQMKMLAMNQFNVTAEYVQCVIQQFLLQLSQTAIQQYNSMSTIFNPQLEPGGQPIQMTETLNSLFVQFLDQHFQIKADSELVLNKIAYVLQTFSEDQSQNVNDDSLYLTLGNVILNQPINADEIQFLVFCYLLAKGGVKISETQQLKKLDFIPTPNVEYISIKRAQLISQIVLNKAVQSGYFEKFITQARATEMIHDLTPPDIQRFKPAIVDESITEGVIQVICVPFFVVTLLKAYRAETMVRLEALRVMYAGSLIEQANLQKSNNISDASRFRIITEIVRTINPLAPSGYINSAYLDAVWRSPSAIWAVLIDACRVRGIFATGLQVPPLDCAMYAVGGYRWLQTPPVVSIFPKLFKLINLLKAIAYQLQSVGNSTLSNISQLILQLNIDEIDQDNQYAVLNVLKSILMQLVQALFSIILTSGEDLSTIPVKTAILQNNNFKLKQTPEFVQKVLEQGVELLTVTCCALCGWELGDFDIYEICKGFNKKIEKGEKIEKSDKVDKAVSRKKAK